MSGGKIKQSVPSTHLTKEENDVIFQLIGKRCLTLSTTITRVFYHTITHEHRAHWLKKYTGLLCYIKDKEKRSYFFRMYCISKRLMIWEHELSDNIIVSREKDFFFTFEGQECKIGLRFAHLDEADSFFKTITSTLERRNRQKKGKNETSKCGKSKKLTRADIGGPIVGTFQHFNHVGMTSRGLDFSGNSEVLRPFFEKVGVTEKQLENKETRKIISKFIQENDVEAILKKEGPLPPLPPRPTIPKRPRVQTPLPPIPSSSPPVHPPLPPLSPVVTAHPVRAVTPTRTPPPPPQATTRLPLEIVYRSTPPPPPPPPMMADSITEQIPTSSDAPDSRGALLMSIRNRPTLKNVDMAPKTSNSNGDPRDALLESIRNGAVLKPVAPSDLSNRTKNDASCDILAGALQSILKNREDKFRGESSSESEDYEDDEWSD